MQILPTTGIDCAKRINMEITADDLYDININIKIGCFYLKYLLDMFDGNITNTLCAYNWGLGNVKDWIDIGNVDDKGMITNIPVKETKDYIEKYKTNIWVYEKLYKFK